jgi:hypothetical protein
VNSAAAALHALGVIAAQSGNPPPNALRHGCLWPTLQPAAGPAACP